MQVIEIPGNKETHAANLFQELTNHGVEIIHIEFDGIGDDGHIENVNFEFRGIPDGSDAQRKRSEVLAKEITWMQISSTYSGGVWVEREIVKSCSVKLCIEDLCYELLSQTNIDWYNNEGGYGTISIRLAGPQEAVLNIDLYERYIKEDLHVFSSNLKVNAFVQDDSMEI